MLGLSSLLRIHRPSPAGIGQAGQADQPLLFAPLPGRLPTLTFHPVTNFTTLIGDETITVYQNKVTGSTWGFRRVIARSQAGQVFVVAALVQDPQTKRLFYRLPYVLAAVKMEAKARVQSSQAKLSRGGHGDNSMLDRALLRFLEGTPAGPHALQLWESWHDQEHLYSVLQYLRDGDLLDCVAANPSTRCLSEPQSRRAIEGALQCLRVLHSAGFMHRDISPENIMVDSNGNGILIDFGSALPMAQSDPEDSSKVAEAYDGPTTTPPPLGGWKVQSPPGEGGPFCKPQYACPWYVWSRPWYGVGYDLWSIGSTLFAVLDGRTLYSAPALVGDPGFAALLAADPIAASSLREPGAVPSSTHAQDGHMQPATPALIALLQAWNSLRPSVGRKCLSAECIDLIARLMRITPGCRPVSAEQVLSHPWFSIGLEEEPQQAVAPARGPLPSLDMEVVQAMHAAAAGKGGTMEIDAGPGAG